MLHKQLSLARKYVEERNLQRKAEKLSQPNNSLSTLVSYTKYGTTNYTVQFSHESGKPLHGKRVANTVTVNNDEHIHCQYLSISIVP